MTRTSLSGFALGAAIILALSQAFVFSPAIRADSDDDDGQITFTVDTSQIDTSNAQNNINPAQSPDIFVRGDTAVIGGTVYPKGKLSPGRQQNDPNDPGIGKYEFRGAYTGPIDAFPIVGFVTEVFQLSRDQSTLLTDGLWPAEGASADRVVLGGTGRFQNTVGWAHEENLGSNKYLFCNLRITFHLRKVTARHER